MTPLAAGAAEINPVREERGWLSGRIDDPSPTAGSFAKPVVGWPPQADSPNGLAQV
jgi:hypothetical protein